MPLSSQQLLDVAFDAERFIDSLSQKTDQGVIWGLASEAPDVKLRTLYAGSAGIALFYLELYAVSGQTRYLQQAEAAGDDILHYVHDRESQPIATHGGWAGYFFVFNELFRATSESRFREAAHWCAARLRDAASDCGAGIGWVAPMPYAKLTGHTGTREIYDVAEGAAGIGIYYLYAAQHQIHEDALTWVKGIADRLLEVAETAEGGKRWQLMDDIPWPFDAPNFAHGTAGVAFFLALAFEATGEQRYLDGALAGAGHVQACAVTVGDGHLVPHVRNDGRDDRFYLGFCHGPAGTARLFKLLTDVTGDTRWQQWSRGLDQGLVALGAPEERGRGFWNNISQCCCDAGIGDHAVWQYRETGDQFYLDLAQRVAAELIKQSEQRGNQRCWPQAEHRTQPDFIQTQTGYMQGAAGVASFFVHLATTLNEQPVKIRFPETPYGRKD